MKKLYLLVFLSLIVLIVNNSFAQCSMKIIGHKGDCYYYPDNTLYSYEQSFIEGVWAAEVDVRTTQDSVLVLCHEGDIGKATTKDGYINELNFSEIKDLDFGTWKNKRFAGLTIPTFIDALKLADKYHKKLFLDIVGWYPYKLAETIKAAGVPQNTCITEPKDLAECSVYHKLLPDMPLIVFGNPTPEQVIDHNFYKQLKDVGVFGFELFYGDVLDTITNPWMNSFRKNLRANGMELWVYTVNDNSVMKQMKDLGVDGIESDRPGALKNYFCNNLDAGYFPEKRITGQWDFNNGNLLATIGSKLLETGDTNIQSQRLQYGMTKTFGLPNINGEIANVIKVPAYDPAHGLGFFTNIMPENLPSTYRDLNYTIIMDMLKPASSSNAYIALFQVDYLNADDATAFIRMSDRGIGIFDVYNGVVLDDTWQRIALVINAPNGKFDKYINGVYVGTTPIPDASMYKFGIYNNWGGLNSLFFSDNNNETDELYVSSLQVRSYPMDAAEVAMLGAASANKIPQILNINPADCPVIIRNPRDTSVVFGANTNFSIVASPNTNYVWQTKVGTEWNDIKGLAFSNKASPTLEINNVTPDLNNTQYRCIVSNDCMVTSSTVTLTVQPTTSVHGYLLYSNNAQTPIANCRIILYYYDGTKLDSMNTNVAGYYNFKNKPSSYYFTKPYFNIPGNGVDPQDALLINRHYIQTLTINDEFKLLAADVNNDATIDPLDALMVNRHYINIIETFTQGEWIYKSYIDVQGNVTHNNFKAICRGDVDASYFVK